MLVSIGAYALIWGWQFAVGIVLLLFVHEMGHVIQLRREGVPASAPLFIPFVGAVVGMKRLPDDAAAEARVGLAGPILGSIGCLIPLGLYAATGNHFFQALAFTGFFLNLFNLAAHAAARRRQGDVRAQPVDVARRTRVDARSRDRLPEPAHHPDPGPRRIRDLAHASRRARTRRNSATSACLRGPGSSLPLFTSDSPWRWWWPWTPRT